MSDPQTDRYARKLSCQLSCVITHTSDSNRAERAVRGHTNGIHHADYVSMVGAAPPGVDVRFTPNTWWADPGRYERLAERVAARDGTVERFDTHAVFTVAGSRGAVINGIETSLQTDNSHVTVCGLPIEERPPLRACSLEVLCEIGREAAWVAPAHPRGHRRSRPRPAETNRYTRGLFETPRY